MKLLTIPKDKYDEYKLDVAFNGYKWDTQFLDSNTVAGYALILSSEEADEVMNLTSKLAKETIDAENFLKDNKRLVKKLKLPKKISSPLFKNVKDYNGDTHIRLMRFDFHPVIGGGYKVSEVNSDVPGGFSEASIMPKLVKNYLPAADNYHSIDFGEKLIHEIAKRVNKGGAIGLVHCTSYSDDRQVMQFLGDRLTALGYHAIYLASDHVRFSMGQAHSILNGQTMPLDAIIRFTPLEWLVRLPKFYKGYFSAATTSCNHPIAIFAQTKRFPLIWDELESAGLDLTYWRKLLPRTVEAKKAKKTEGFITANEARVAPCLHEYERTRQAGKGSKKPPLGADSAVSGGVGAYSEGLIPFIFKPVYGRVGENISIKEAISDEEYKKILKDVRRNKNRYIAQQMFQSSPLISSEGESFHLCLGSYSLDKSFAGFYARISKTARIDSAAADIPVLIEKK